MSSDNLIKQTFWFLIEDYSYRYGGYAEGGSDFISTKVKIRIEPGRKTPYSYVYYIGEPDFTRLTLFEVLRYFEGKPFDHDFDAHSLGVNLNFIANIFKKHASMISNEIDKWWLPLQLDRYHALKEEYAREGQLSIFLNNRKYLYDYLKSKGAM